MRQLEKAAHSPASPWVGRENAGWERSQDNQENTSATSSGARCCQFLCQGGRWPCHSTVGTVGTHLGDQCHSAGSKAVTGTAQETCKGPEPHLHLSPLRRPGYSAACLSPLAKAPAQPAAPRLPLVTGNVRRPGPPRSFGKCLAGTALFCSFHLEKSSHPPDRAPCVGDVGGWMGQGTLHSSSVPYPTLRGQAALNYPASIPTHMFSPKPHTLSMSADSKCTKRNPQNTNTINRATLTSSRSCHDTGTAWHV